MTSAIIAIAAILFCFRILFGKPVMEWLDRVEGRRGESRRLYNVRHQLWHPESPGVKVTVAPGLPRRLGLVREPFATSREMKSVYEVNARRGDPRRAVQERVLSADELRELEWKMGIGPFAGKEDWCDPAKQCHHRDHGPIDEETGLWEMIMWNEGSPRSGRILFPAFEGDSGERPVATGVAPNRKVNPNLTKWKGIKALERADQLAQEGRPLMGYCTSTLHEHIELRTMDGVVRRRCENY